MPNYNYLPNNKSDFPHVANIDTFKYDNKLDYSRFNATQMKLQICTVPWDVGEAHVGQRTISGIGNVVYFGSKENRDAWFAAIPDTDCYRFETKFKELHREQIIDVPVPYDICAKHNYLVDNSPLQYENETGVRKWFWFIREVEFLAPNTTRLHLLDDAFQTWIYDVNITGMILERGHAPMFDMRAAEFLQNPLENCTYLLTEDVNFGNANIVKNSDAVIFNDGEMYACIATTGNPYGTWGGKLSQVWQTPAAAYYTNNGAPSVFVFGIPVANLNTFLSNVTADYPQFKQTVQGIFFAAQKMISLGNSFSFAGVTCYPLSSNRVTLDLTELEKSLFGYSSNYADIAKLYTSPYAHIEVCDESGNVDIINVEDTTGTLEVSAMLSLAYPFINIDAHILGTGGSIAGNVTYRNIDAHTFATAGQWYETLRSWNVPTFAVVLDPARENDYSTHFDRQQAVTAYTNAQANQNALANTDVANAALTNTANTAITNRSNSSANDFADNTTAYNSSSASAGNAYTAANATSTIQANEQQAAVSAVTGVASATMGALNAKSPAGAVGSIVDGLIGAAGTLASTNIGNALTAAQAGNAQIHNTQMASLSSTKTNNDTWDQTAAASDITSLNNDLNTATTANNAATQIANAARDAATAQSAIDNDIAQAGLRAPFMYGSFANGDSSTTKPIGLFANIVTQSKAAIESAGDEFLRYGYMLDRQWTFDGNWNVGKYFTYWKLRDFWVSNLNVPDLYMDKLRFFLFGGVTICAHLNISDVLTYMTTSMNRGMKWNLHMKKLSVSINYTEMILKILPLTMLH